MIDKTREIKDMRELGTLHNYIPNKTWFVSLSFVQALLSKMHKLIFVTASHSHHSACREFQSASQSLSLPGLENNKCQKVINPQCDMTCRIVLPHSHSIPLPSLWEDIYVLIPPPQRHRVVRSPQIVKQILSLMRCHDKKSKGPLTFAGRDLAHL